MELSSHDVARFVAKTYRDDNGVLRWNGAKSNGYGQFSFRAKTYTAHSVAWVIAHGPLPDGWIVRFADGTDRDVVDSRYLVAGPRQASKVDEAAIADQVMADTRSQEAIAEAYGITRDAVRRIKSGKYSRGTYSDREVHKLLDNYIEIKSMMLPRGSLRNDTAYESSIVTEQGASGLYKRSFHAHAKGASNSRAGTEDLFVATLDLESALTVLSDEDYTLVLAVCIMQRMDHDEAAAHFGFASGDSVRRVIKKIVTKLRREMNGNERDEQAV